MISFVRFLSSRIAVLTTTQIGVEKNVALIIAEQTRWRIAGKKVAYASWEALLVCSFNREAFRSADFALVQQLSWNLFKQNASITSRSKTVDLTLPRNTRCSKSAPFSRAPLARHAIPLKINHKSLMKLRNYIKIRFVVDKRLCLKTTLRIVKVAVSFPCSTFHSWTKLGTRLLKLIAIPSLTLLTS